ncbi:MAG TPA: surface-adhesin E family protein [Longimicrobium sp.]|nr:surface-adhesin E family protein [Longimicrobium sp.]
MTRILLLAAAVLLFRAVPAHAQPGDRWVRAGGSDNFSTYVDVTRITTGADGIVSAWTRREYNQIQRREWATYDVQINRMEFDCRRSLTRLRYAAYELAGEIVETTTWAPGESEWGEVIPESVGEAVLTFICEFVNGRR